MIIGDFNCQPALLAETMGPTLKKAGAVVFAPINPTHYPGGEAAPATLEYGIVDDRISNSRAVRAIEVDNDLSIGKHRAVKISVSNKGHVCYGT